MMETDRKHLNAMESAESGDILVRLHLPDLSSNRQILKQALCLISMLIFV